MQVWLITGCSSGFGRVFAEAALAEGHAVAATARKAESLEGLGAAAPDRFLPLSLDVTDPAACHRAVQETLARFGRVDVLVNNAGYGMVGALEESSGGEIRRLFETNVFGLIEMTKAALPVLRAQRSGWVVNLSSIAGLAATPGFSVYNASKFAVEGLSEALAGEVASFGIRVLIVEPGPFRTDFAGRSIVHAAPLPDYAQAIATTRKYIADADGRQTGDPVRAARAILDHIAQNRPELRMVLGKIAMNRVEAKLKTLRGELDSGLERALGADFPE
ncbi:MAG TPA: oxidoreductase [Holophagaceae bacterium]|nr:oxidoreductase [Holophagaceae bacterium]